MAAKLVRTVTGTKGNKTIKLDIFDDGTTKVTTVGYGGASCLNDAVVKGIERSLGTVESVEKTTEFFNPSAAANVAKAGQ